MFSDEFNSFCSLAGQQKSTEFMEMECSLHIPTKLKVEHPLNIACVTIVFAPGRHGTHIERKSHTKDRNHLHSMQVYSFL